MCKHEEKYCPRCNGLFECRVGNILQCQCSGIVFSEAEQKYLESKWDDCLCRNCLLFLKNSFDEQRKELPL